MPGNAKDVRNMVGKDYNVEIIVDTPLEVCKRWNLKDLDAKDCSGEIKGFTGIDDSHENPFPRRFDWIRQSIFLKCMSA